MAMIPIYTYNIKDTSRYVIQLYDYVEIENGLNIYYTVCCMLGQGNMLYKETIIVRLLTDIVKQSSIIGNLNCVFVANLIRKSFRRDNKWQREAYERINNTALAFESLEDNTSIELY